jgi:hypothetical protein
LFVCLFVAFGLQYAHHRVILLPVLLQCIFAYGQVSLIELQSCSSRWLFSVLLLITVCNPLLPSFTLDWQRKDVYNVWF